MNRTINSAATKKRSIRSVHNRVDLEFGDIAAQKVDLTRVRFQGARRSTDQEPLVCNT